MSKNRFIEHTHTSWGGRIKNAFTGIIIGLIFFVAAFPLLFWNESRAVHRYQTLKEGEGAVVSVSPDRVDPANQGRLVHLSGTADTRQTLTDTDFAVSQTALRLMRTVQMYQWNENRETRNEKKTGGGEKKITTYSYTKVWSASPIDASQFKRPDGHENPISLPFASQTLNASVVMVGAFVLSPSLVQEIDDWVPVSMDALAPLPSVLGSSGMLSGNGYYRGRDPDAPAIGDIRIRFKAVYPGTVSLIAAQQGRSFSAYTTSAGGSIQLLQTGSHGAVDMFKTAHVHNRLLTWGIRLGGVLIMFIGLRILFKPLAVFADVIPIAGSLIEAGTGIIAFVLAMCFSLMVMGVAWIFYRPLLGLSLMGGAVAVVVWGLVKRKRKNGPPVAAVPPHPVHPASKTTAAFPPIPPPPANLSSAPKATSASSESYTGSAGGWIKIGKEAYAAGHFDKAAHAFSKAIALDTGNGSAIYNLGVVRNKTGNDAGAIDCFKKAAALGNERAKKLLTAQNIDW